MKNTIISLKKDNRGQSLVEAALILPVIIIIVFGIIEFGRVFNAYQVVLNASREGARAASVGKTNGEITAAVSAKASSLGSVTTGITPSGSRTYGSEVTVSVDYNLNLVIPVISNLIAPGGVMNIDASTTMRVEKSSP